VTRTITFVIDSRSERAIKELQRDLNVSSVAGVMRSALTLLREASLVTRRGGKVILREVGTGIERQVILDK